MVHELTIKITGEAGQGIQTIGLALCKIFKDAGYYLFANQDYMSRIRGGNNVFQLRIADKPVYAPRKFSDIIITLDRFSVECHKDTVSPDGVILLDKKRFNISEEHSRFVHIPMFDMAREAGGDEQFVNSLACGIVTGMMGIEGRFVVKVIKDTFSQKTDDILQRNLKAAKAGYDFSKIHLPQNRFIIQSGNFTESLLMNGNEAIALGAIAAGCKFYSAYPMTPSTSIMNVMAHYAKDFHIVVEQAEDEIAAINMIVGASFAGVRSMTGTSGGGFALMAEGLSLAGMTETPIVVVDAQRPAPATGFPTRTEQGDLEFLLHAGHGEFARAVFSPGTIEEAFFVSIRAFDLAEKYQIPVLIMTDQHLADSYMNIDKIDLERIKIQRHIISKEDSGLVKDYKRYQFTESGISPRAVPSWIDDVIYADSDEHTEEGHITESATMRNLMTEKRFYKKMKGLSEETEKLRVYNIQGADSVLIGFGSTYGVLKEVCESSCQQKIGHIHIPQVWPFPVAEITALLKDAKEIIVVENNAGAQFARLLRRETGIKADKSLLKYDGRPFDLDYLLEQVEKG